MKIVIGTKNDKRIEDVITSNVLHGKDVYFDGTEYYCEALNYSTLYVSPDVLFYSVPEGTYRFINGVPYLIEE